MTDEDVLTPRPLPDGTRLLHIGPHKTGTTALQAALWQARASMLDQGVRHAGRFRNPVSAVRAVTGQLSLYSDRPPPMRDWRSLVGEISAAEEPRLVVSASSSPTPTTPRSGASPRTSTPPAFGSRSRFVRLLGSSPRCGSRTFRRGSVRPSIGSCTTYFRSRRLLRRPASGPSTDTTS